MSFSKQFVAGLKAITKDGCIRVDEVVVAMAKANFEAAADIYITTMRALPEASKRIRESGFYLKQDCGRCGSEVTFGLNVSEMWAEMKQRLEAAGWQLSADGTDDLCPACAKKEPKP
jgi:hypothetical protein